jgi:hypothetical protein
MLGGEDDDGVDGDGNGVFKFTPAAAACEPLFFCAVALPTGLASVIYASLVLTKSKG